jgi:hypothetical protein
LWSCESAIIWKNRYQKACTEWIIIVFFWFWIFEVLAQDSQMGFQIPGTLDKFLTKFQEVLTKLKKTFKKFRKP